MKQNHWKSKVLVAFLFLEDAWRRLEYLFWNYTMVSQAEPANSLAVRGPSSVVSRASTSRHHRRHGRSHTGGSSYIPQNDFPVFTHTGDVEIIIKAGAKTNRYLLHRLILTNCSGFFEASTSQEWSRAAEVGGSVVGELARIGEESGSDVGRNEGGPRRRWRYELDSGPNNNDIPMLVPKPESSLSFSANDTRPPPPVRNKPPSSNTSFFRSVANLSISHSTPAPPQITQEDQDLLNHYDNLFRIFYNHSPHLDSIDIATAYIQCKSLLTLADLYDALPVVGPRIDHHLLQFQSRLWKQIAKYPSSYLKLGYLSQSKTIFGEALIHVVGAWPAGERHIRNQLPDQILEIIEDKVEDLRDMVGECRGAVISLNPTDCEGRASEPGKCICGLVGGKFISTMAGGKYITTSHTSPANSSHSETCWRCASHASFARVLFSRHSTSAATSSIDHITKSANRQDIQDAGQREQQRVFRARRLQALFEINTRAL
ncbi:hypothetical protein EYC84_004789 [Monilinia fructicola]|uniref:BTB domain-containing protein n=1 Tax=Monilinia fructicola TaxID=38448 RepID=A0A5M9K6J9_MONFR|nr:hypothetical protein EYC84_004789 [Monilinia fructicola]